MFVLVGHAQAYHPTLEEQIAELSNSLTEEEEALVVRLLVTEIHGVQEPERTEAALSILWTVFARTATQYLSDGTIESTLGWNSGGVWQFPPLVVWGCTETTTNCPDFRDTAPFYEMLRKFQTGQRGSCTGYYYYHEFTWPSECEIGGAYDPTYWHNGWPAAEVPARLLPPTHYQRSREHWRWMSAGWVT